MATHPPRDESGSADGSAGHTPAGRLRLWRALGPGLLMAGAAIGVSHIVQSTRAGAEFGWQLLGIVLLVNLFKYPFFEYGHRYAAAAGESLLHGYARMGRAYLAFFLLLNTVTAVVSVAGVTSVTAVLAGRFFGIEWDMARWSALILAFCFVFLWIGRYRLLDMVMKLMMSLLFLATAAAFAVALAEGPAAAEGFVSPSPWTAAGLLFVIALMGWMPAPIEISALQSLWVGAKERTTGARYSMGGAFFDFNIGYALTVVLAVLFLGMGALVLHGSGETFATSGAAFAEQFVRIYADRLGEWTAPLVAGAALATMFSTTLAVIDAYPRSLAVGYSLLFRAEDDEYGRRRHLAAVAVCALTAVFIIWSFAAELIALVTLATVIAFLAAPFFAFLNLRLIRSRHTPEAQRPGAVLQVLSLVGLVYLGGFGLVYLWFGWMA
ncbi:MAG: divalent metal cation transporter [Opitutales bacterium]|nr:divalent metal cation transporter [Opitutales bacterium]